MLNKKSILYSCFTLALFFLLLAISTHSFAQFYQSGQDPASVKWKQINTSNFQVIFPSEFEKEANRLANTLEYLYDHVSQTLKHKPRKISVLLHSQSAYSNGMVTWAPKRMELYTTPAQDNYAQDWLDQLAVHELRHVVQIDKLNQGITQIGGILFGQQAVGAITGLLPRWFLEGDAVNTETALTSTGRGRTASFEMEMKTLITSRTLFSYEKALRGSYKDYIPDPYQLGYPLVAWTRKNYGSDIFNKDLNFVGQNPFVLFPFPLSLKKQIGLPSAKLYRTAYLDLKSQWEKQISLVPEQHYFTWNQKHKKNYTNYRFPQFINDSTILAVKSGIDQLTEFVMIHKDGKEEKIHTPGSYNNDRLSYAHGRFVWGEEIPDARWSNRSYNCIKIFDLHTNSVKLITKKTRYFAPALSKDGNKIATVEVTRSNEIYLVILNANTGQIEERILSPDNKFLQLPEWTYHNEIVLVTTDRKGKNLELLNLSTKTWNTIIAKTFRNITSPTEAGNYFVFSGDYNGTDNLYAINKTDTTIWQITNARYGIKDAAFSANNNMLSFAQYSSQGFDIVSSSLNKESWKNIREIADASPKLYEASAKQEHFNFQDSVIPNNPYRVRSYSKLAHSINVHSWAPFYYDYNSLNTSNNTITPGLSLLSQDKLGTCVASAGYSYDQGQSLWKTNITYLGLYPVIDFSLSTGGALNLYRETNWLPNIIGQNIKTTSTIYLPLIFTQSRYATGITPLVQWEYDNDLFLNPSDSSYYQGMHFINYNLYFYRYLRPSYRDLAPRWGFSVTSRYTYTPFEDVQFNSIWYVRGRLYLPGILKHHSLQLSLGYQEQNPLRYMFSSRLSFPRGYAAQRTYTLTAFTSDYTFPVCYPDLALGPVLYFKRIRGNLFFDYAANSFKYVNSQKKVASATDYLSSVGIDLTTDFHFLRIIFPINAGVRMIYAPELKQYSSQLLLSLDLSNY
jgi:hypothetical protein